MCFCHMPELARKVQALRESVKPSGDNQPASFDEKAANELYLFLIQPALPYLKSDHLLIIPQEELATLPFQALHNPQTGEYLGETFEVSSAPSATILSTLKSRANIKSGRLLAVADPEQQNAAGEVRFIGALYPGRSRVVALQPVTKAELMPWINNYNLIHLSVHGRFNGKDPLLSFLQFSPTASDDGHLTAAEMFGLPLQRDSLVVLSACESGVVEETHSSEVLGMERSASIRWGRQPGTFTLAGGRGIDTDMDGNLLQGGTDQASRYRVEAGSPRGKGSSRI